MDVYLIRYGIKCAKPALTNRLKRLFDLYSKCVQEVGFERFPVAHFREYFLKAFAAFCIERLRNTCFLCEFQRFSMGMGALRYHFVVK